MLAGTLNERVAFYIINYANKIKKKKARKSKKDFEMKKDVKREKREKERKKEIISLKKFIFAIPFPW